MYLFLEVVSGVLSVLKLLTERKEFTFLEYSLEFMITMVFPLYRAELITRKTGRNTIKSGPRSPITAHKLEKLQIYLKTPT
jgi:hypothetical protein